MEFSRPEYWRRYPFPGSSQPRDQTQVSHIAGDSLPAEPQEKPRVTGKIFKYLLTYISQSTGFFPWATCLSTPKGHPLPVQWNTKYRRGTEARSYQLCWNVHLGSTHMRGLLDRVREKPRAEEFCFISHMREREETTFPIWLWEEMMLKQNQYTLLVR